MSTYLSALSAATQTQCPHSKLLLLCIADKANHEHITHTTGAHLMAYTELSEAELYFALQRLYSLKIVEFSHKSADPQTFKTARILEADQLHIAINPDALV